MFLFLNKGGEQCSLSKLRKNNPKSNLIQNLKKSLFINISFTYLCFPVWVKSPLYLFLSAWLTSWPIDSIWQKLQSEKEEERYRGNLDGGLLKTRMTTSINSEALTDWRINIHRIDAYIWEESTEKKLDLYLLIRGRENRVSP